VAPRSLDNGLKVLEDAAARILPPRLARRLHGRVAPAAAGGRHVPARAPACAPADLPFAGGAVQFFPRSVRGACGLGAARDVRRASRCSSCRACTCWSRRTTSRGAQRKARARPSRARPSFRRRRAPKHRP